MAGQDVPTKPTVPPADVLKLRAKLIFEESMETIQALACDVVLNASGELEVVQVTDSVHRILDVLDGCADLSVVTIGTLSSFGMPDKPILREVDDANLRKFGEGSYRREDGKWIKPKNWKAPDLMRLWVRYGGEDQD